MKCIGLLGGMSAASTQLYYAELIRLAAGQGGLHSPNLLIRSLDFAAIAEMQAHGDWPALGRLLKAEAQAMEAGGAELLVLATNTMHKLAEEMCEGVQLPFIHIADATAAAIRAAGLNRPGLMGTSFTMEQEFYTGRLSAAGLQPVLPKADDRAEVHRVIYEELCRNDIREESRASYIAIAERLAEYGADCLILGCTEVGLLLNETNVPVPVFDTTLLHCEAAYAAALAPSPGAG